MLFFHPLERGQHSSRCWCLPCNRKSPFQFKETISKDDKRLTSFHDIPLMRGSKKAIATYFCSSVAIFILYAFIQRRYKEFFQLRLKEHSSFIILQKGTKKRPNSWTPLGQKGFRVFFSPCFSQSPLLTDFTPFETGL
jgi:hypothetical protein